MIPEKIQPYFRTILQKKDGDNTLIGGILTCCNSNNFEVYVVGKIKYSVFNKIYLLPEDDKIVLEVRCKKCGKVISLFDSSCDGFEQCGKKQYTHTATKPLVCRRCQENDFSLGVKYEYPNIKELENIGMTETDNAFTWVWITLECNKCGMKYSNFVDCETA